MRTNPQRVETLQAYQDRSQATRRLKEEVAALKLTNEKKKQKVQRLKQERDQAVQLLVEVCKTGWSQHAQLQSLLQQVQAFREGGGDPNGELPIETRQLMEDNARQADQTWTAADQRM